MTRFCVRPTNTHPSYHRTSLCSQTSQRQLQDPRKSLCKCRSGSRQNPQRRFSEVMPSRRWQSHGKGPESRIGHPETCCLLCRLGGTPHLPKVNLHLGEQEFLHPTLNGEPGTLSWPAECFSLVKRNLNTFVSRFAPRRDTAAKRGDRRRQMTSSSPRGGFIMCNNADPVTFPLTRQS